MDEQMKKDLAKLSKSIYTDKNFSINGTNGEDVLRNAIFNAMGVEPGTTGNSLYYAFDDNKNKVFEIINVTVDALTPKIISDEFNHLANFQNIPLGGVARFVNPNPKLFSVSKIATGTQDLRRQNMIGSSYTVSTDKYGVAVYTELEQFLLGMVDWAAFITNISTSFSAAVAMRIYEAFADSYATAKTHLRANGTFSLDTLLDLVAHVKASAGVNEVTVYGTPNALGNVASQVDMLSDAMKDDINRLGYLTTFRGVTFMALPERYIPGTNEFLVSDSTLTIVPTANKIVDVVFEGETFTREELAPEHQSLQMTFVMERNMGIQVNQSAVYGVYDLG